MNAPEATDSTVRAKKVDLASLLAPEYPEYENSVALAKELLRQPQQEPTSPFVVPSFETVLREVLRPWLN